MVNFDWRRGRDSYVASVPPPNVDLHRRCPKASRALVRYLAVGVSGLAALPASALGAPPNDSYFSIAGRLNQPGTPLAKSYVVSSNNIGASDEGFEHNQCRPPSANGQVTNFGSSVFYEINPPITGRFNIVVTPVGGFLPVVALYEFTPLAYPSYNYSNNAPCNGPAPPLNTATLTPQPSFPVLAAGRHYKIQIGGVKSPNDPGGTSSQGSFTLRLSYDPDTDGDGLFDSADRCANARGPSGLGGCPDRDADGVADIDDRCPKENNEYRPDRRRRGCLQILQLDDDVTPKLSFNGIPGYGIRVTRFIVSGVPRGARVRVSCRTPHGRSCGKRARTARRLRFDNLRRKRLAAGSRITVSVTARRSVGYFGRYKILNRSPGYKLKQGCITLRKKKVSFRRRSCR